MIKVQIDEADKIDVERKKGSLFVDGEVFQGEIVKIDDTSFKVYDINKIFRIDVLDIDRNKNKITLKVDDLTLDVLVTDHIDQVLDKLGMNTVVSTIVQDIKAPIPGFILDVMVSEGDEVSEGDHLLVLEAMKMENVIKSPKKGKIGTVSVSEKESVTKDQVLISFD